MLTLLHTFRCRQSCVGTMPAHALQNSAGQHAYFRPTGGVSWLNVLCTRLRLLSQCKGDHTALQRLSDAQDFVANLQQNANSMHDRCWSLFNKQDRCCHVTVYGIIHTSGWNLLVSQPSNDLVMVHK